MTIQEYSKITGLNINKVYRYSKYKSWVNSSIKDMTFEDLPLCMKYSIMQILVNLECIKKGTTYHSCYYGIIKSGFKVNSKGFITNILCNPDLLNKRYLIDKIISLNHVDKLIDITRSFIENKKAIKIN